MLVTFDVLAYFYPLMTYLGDSLRAGRLPLWNPDHFVGAPFLANPQTAVFYPASWLTALLPAPLAYSWSIVLHALIAALGAYACGRLALRLGPLGALTCALVFAFGGFFTAQAVHINQLAAAAWLPWLVLSADSLTRRPRLPVALVGGLLLALTILAGHSQVVFLSAWAVGIWAGVALLSGLIAEWRRGTDARSIVRWLAPRLGALGLLGALGVALAAAQLLPTLELSGEGIRDGGLTFDEAASFSLPPWKALVALLPTFGGVGAFSEWIGYVGVAALALAGVALIGRRDPRVATLALLVGVGLLFAFGKFTPVYEVLCRYFLGFDLFRVPARWLLLYSFGVAGLAGVGIEMVGAKPGAGVGSARSILARLAALALAIVVLLVAYETTQSQFPLERAGWRVAAAWAIVAAAAVGLLAVGLARSGAERSVLPKFALLALVAAELLAASGSLDVNRVNVLDAATAPPAEIQFLRSRPGLHRALGISETAYEVGDVNAIRGRLAGTLTPDEIYDYLVALKHKETLTPNISLSFGLASLDGYDGGVLPLRRYLDVKSLFPNEGTNVIDGRLRLQLRHVPDARLLGWLNTRFVVLDRAADLWQDGHYYDLAFSREAKPDRPLSLGDLGLNATPALGIVAEIDGAAVADGEAIATLRVADASGRTVDLPLRFGREIRLGGERARAATLDLPPDFAPESLSLEYGLDSGRLILRSLSAHGASPDADQVIGLSSDCRLVFLGDAKIYELLDVTPRAYFAGGVRLVADDAAARALLARPDFDPRREAVVAAEEWPGAAPTAGLSVGSATVVSWQPERIVVDVQAEGPGVLVLTDAHYPGWRASVDGGEAPIVRTDLAFRGVPVGAGAHRVELTYEPSSLRLGLAASGVALGASIVAFVLWLIRGLTRRIAG